MGNTTLKLGDSSFLDTAKNTRVELRTSSEIKEQLRAASLLAGVDMTSFILMAATQKAHEMIEAHNVRSLNEIAWNKLNEIIMSPRQPSEKLQQLIKDTSRNVKRRTRNLC